MKSKDAKAECAGLKFQWERYLMTLDRDNKYGRHRRNKN